MKFTVSEKMKKIIGKAQKQQRKHRNVLLCKGVPNEKICATYNRKDSGEGMQHLGDAMCKKINLSWQAQCVGKSSADFGWGVGRSAFPSEPYQPPDSEGTTK